MLHNAITPLLHWLHNHPQWASFFAFIVAFSESLAIIGSFMPGSAMIITIGMLVGSGVIPMVETFAWAISGAFLGDYISYWIGYHFRDRLCDWWIFKKYPFILNKGKTFFAEHGGKSIIIGRFTGPVRSIIPVTAGMLKMSQTRFFIANALASSLWAIVYITPGILLGAATAELDTKTATHVFFIILLSLLFIWLLSCIIKASSLWCVDKLNRFLDYSWTFMRRHQNLHFITDFLQNPHHPEGHGQLGLALFCIPTLLLSIFFITTTPLSSLDAIVFHVLQSIHTPRLDAFFIAVNLSTYPILLFLYSTLCALWLTYRKNLRASLHLFILSLACAMTVYTLKSWMLPIFRMTSSFTPSHSFPSVHVAIAVTIVGFISFLFSQACQKEHRRFIWWGAGVFLMCISVGQLYLGVHCLSDVIAAWLVGTTWMLLGILAYRRRLCSPLCISELCLVIIFSFITLGGSFVYLQFKQNYQHYRPHYTQFYMSLKQWWTQTQVVLPSYRKNRLGKPDAPLNIQWADTLLHIKKSLLKNGWLQINKSSSVTLLKHIAAKNRSHQLPLLSQLYLNQHPVLTFFKFIDSKQPIVIFYLWDSHIHFTDHTIPLWIGSCTYRTLWHWTHRAKHQAPRTLALHYLQPALASFSWRTLKLHTPSDLKLQQKNHFRLILIKPR